MLTLTCFTLLLPRQHLNSLESLLWLLKMDGLTLINKHCNTISMLIFSVLVMCATCLQPKQLLVFSIKCLLSLTILLLLWAKEKSKNISQPCITMGTTRVHFSQVMANLCLWSSNTVVLPTNQSSPIKAYLEEPSTGLKRSFSHSLTGT